MKLLFVDDITYAMKYYVKALRDGGIDVQVRSDVDRALADLEAQSGWDGAIVDVMFTNPGPPKRYLAANPDGQAVGPLLVKDLRDLRPGLKIIALTNLTGTPAARQLANMVDVRVYNKLSGNPLAFRDLALKFFAPGPPASASKIPAEQ